MFESPMRLATTQPALPLARAINRRAWLIYTIDGALLGLFMISACAFTALIEHPSSPVRKAIESTFLRRSLIGAAMGTTAVALIYSSWGRRSGALMNPALTLCHLRLRRLAATDAAGYILAQFAGAASGMAIVAALLRPALSHPSVNFATTQPGVSGIAAAWFGEFAIALILMTVIMTLNKFPSLNRFTGLFAAALVALFITFEAPLSGMGLNPARTLSSELCANLFTGWWIYFTAPLAGMLTAIELHRATS